MEHTYPYDLERQWLVERLETLSVKEKYQLAAAMLTTGCLEEVSGKAGEVKPGKYEWAIGIVDTTRENAIGLRLAAQGDFTASGWLKLQEVTVQN